MKKSINITEITKKKIDYYCDYCNNLIYSINIPEKKHTTNQDWILKNYNNKDCCNNCYEKFIKEKQNNCNHEFTKFDISVSILYHKTHYYDSAKLICGKCDFVKNKMTGENYWCEYNLLGNEVEFELKQKQLLELIKSWNDIIIPDCKKCDCDDDEIWE